jgi:hypothetical protein
MGRITENMLATFNAQLDAIERGTSKPDVLFALERSVAQMRINDVEMPRAFTDRAERIFAQQFQVRGSERLKELEAQNYSGSPANTAQSLTSARKIFQKAGKAVLDDGRFKDPVLEGRFQAIKSRYHVSELNA